MLVYRFAILLNGPYGFFRLTYSWMGKNMGFPYRGMADCNGALGRVFEVSIENIRAFSGQKIFDGPLSKVEVTARQNAVFFCLFHSLFAPFITVREGGGVSAEEISQKKSMFARGKVGKN